MNQQYQALYRQWRPRTFAEVAGQEHITRTLRNAVKNGRLVHAYLFCGPRGTGKTSTAKILAKAVNCQSGSDGEPCNQCPNCQRIDAGNSLDVLEIDAASNRGIDEVRELIEKIPLGAVEGRYKVYIIDEVHMLTTEAFNAILKTLEEPPAHALFILATTEPRKVLPTILSRCQRFDFHILSVAVISKRLQEVAAANEVHIEPAALSLLARKAAGGLRDALGLLDQILAGGSQELITVDRAATILGTAQLDTLLQLIDALAARDGARLLLLLDTTLRSGIEPKQLLEDLLDYTRNLLLLHTDPQAGQFTGLLPEEIEQAIAQAQKFTDERLLDLMERLQQGSAALRWSSQPRILLEMTLIGFIVAPMPALQDLARRIEKLEKRLLQLDSGELPADKGLPKKKQPEAAVKSCEKINSQPEAPAVIEQKEKVPAKKTAQKTEKKLPIQPTIEQKEKKAPIVVAAAAAKEQTPPGPGLELAVVKKRWDEVLTVARQESVHLQAYLREAEPAAADGDTLTLTVTTDFHRGMLEQAANKEKVEKVLNKVFARPLRLLITAEKEPPSEQTKEEVIEQIKEYFGPEKVEIID